MVIQMSLDVSCLNVTKKLYETLKVRVIFITC